MLGIRRKSAEMIMHTKRREKLLTYDGMRELILNEYGVDVPKKTMVNDAWAGVLTGLVYIGTKPYGTETIARRYIEGKISPISPRRRARLRRGEGVTM
jgi:hypothetical protein